jgi:hypothetical protein
VVLDTTSYGDQEVASKELTLMYPSWTDTANVTSTDGAITLSAIATGTYTITSETTLSLTNGDLVITYVATLSDEYRVSCSGSLCGLLPCIQNLLQVHGAAVKNGFSPYQYFVDSILLNYVQAVEYKKCGEFDKYQERVDAIESLLDASGCECSCCDNDALYWVINIDPEENNILVELQNAVAALALADIALQEDIDDVNDRLVLNSLLFTNNERIIGATLWNEVVFDVPTALFVSGDQPRSLGCLDIEITGSTADTADEITLRNETTESSIAASFITSGDKFKVLIRLVCSGLNAVKASVDLMYLNGSSVYTGSDTPTYTVVDWDFSADTNQLKLYCDNEDMDFIDQIKVTTHKNA